jgi:hypothetical protein
MKRRTIVLALVAVALLGAWGVQEAALRAARRPQVVRAASRPRPAVPASPIDTTLDALWARHAATYRVRPDTRIVDALTEARRFLSGGTDTAAARVVADGDGWRVALGDSAVGRLPRFPDFDDALALIEPHARLAAGGGGAASPEAAAAAARVHAAVDSLDPLEALRRADGLWREAPGDRATLRAAARAAVLAALTCEDRLQQAELLTARAVALVGIARAAGAGDLDAELALLAQHMGYATAARRHAGALPAADPVRAFVTHDGSKLSALASAGTASRRDQWLWLRALARERRGREWWAWQQRCFPDSGFTGLIATATGLEMNRFESNEAIAVAVLARAWEDLDPRFRDDAPWLERLLGPRLASVLAAYDEAIARRTGASSAALLDERAMSALYHGPLFSSLYTLGDHALRQLGSTPRSRGLAREVETTAGGAAAEFARWMADHAAVLEGRMSIAAIRNHFEQPSVLGATVAFHDYRVIASQLSDAPADVFRAMRALGTRLDTRPALRAEYGFDLRRTGFGLPMAEDLLRTAREALGSDEPSLEVWWRVTAGDSAGTLALLDDPSLDAQARLELLHAIGDAGYLSRDAVERAHAAAVKLHPGDWSLLDAYVDLLVDNGRTGQAIRALKRWLIAPGPDAAALAPIVARARLARLISDGGDPAQALVILGDLDDTGHMSAYGAKARALIALGRLGEAAEVVERARERYPFVGSARILEAEIAWQRGHPMIAARALAARRDALTGASVRRDLASAFSRCFRGRSESAAGAIDALARLHLLDLATAASMAGRAEADGDPRLAFEILSRVRVREPHRSIGQTWAYERLLKFAPRDSALAWLDRSLPPDMRIVAQIVATEENMPEIVWRWDAPAGGHDDYVTVLRAAWLAEFGTADDPRRAEVLRLAAGAGDSRYGHIARYLLGDLGEAALLREARGVKPKCEIYYFVGLRAETEGRHADAARWYALAVGTGSKGDAEYRWAFTRLRLYRDHGLRLDRTDAPGPARGDRAA